MDTHVPNSTPTSMNIDDIAFNRFESNKRNAMQLSWLLCSTDTHTHRQLVYRASESNCDRLSIRLLLLYFLFLLLLSEFILVRFVFFAVWISYMYYFISTFCSDQHAYIIYIFRCGRCPISSYYCWPFNPLQCDDHSSRFCLCFNNCQMLKHLLSIKWQNRPIHS